MKTIFKFLAIIVLFVSSVSTYSMDNIDNKQNNKSENIYATGFSSAIDIDDSRN